MSFMKKNVNAILLILVVLVSLSFAGFTVYYQQTFENVSMEYGAKMKELNKVTDQLQIHRNLLNKTSYELEVKSTRETDLSQKFTEVKGEKEQLEIVKSELEKNILEVKIELTKKTVELEAANKEVTSLKSTISTKNSEIASLTDQKKTLNTEKESICTALTAAGGTSTYCD